MYVSEKGLERDTDPDTVTSVWKTDTFPLRQSRKFILINLLIGSPFCYSRNSALWYSSILDLFQCLVGEVG